MPPWPGFSIRTSASITTFPVGSSGARVFVTPQLFRLRDELESNLLRPKRRALHHTEAAFRLLVVVGDSACGTSVLTSFNRAPPVALSGMVADSHMNEL